MDVPLVTNGAAFCTESRAKGHEYSNDQHVNEISKLFDNDNFIIVNNSIIEIIII